MAHLDYAALNATVRYTMWSVFRVEPGRLGDDRAAAATQATEFVEALERKDVVVRGVYDLAALDGITAAPVAVHVQRWGGGLPQYGVGHLDKVRRLEQALPAGLAVAGSALHGVGVPACIGTARAAAERVAAQLVAVPAG